MKKVIAVKEGDWSLNLEDPYYEAHTEDVIEESIEAVKQTKEGHYVNLVTPGACGEPGTWLIPQLLLRLQTARLPYREIVYISQCGCGGYVTRVIR